MIYLFHERRQRLVWFTGTFQKYYNEVFRSERGYLPTLILN